MAKILVVDDNNELRAVLGRVLGRAKHEVTLAANGNEAMRLIQANIFDLVITDMVMPEKAGIATIMELRRKIPTLKIIAMSGGGMGDSITYLDLARKLGVEQTLAKPFPAEELLQAVDRALSQEG